MSKEIEFNLKRRILEDLKIRNLGNENTIAGEYYKNKYTYKQTFKMFEDYKKSVLSLGDDGPITMSAPTIISSVNMFYGTMEANRIANMSGPGFLYTYPEKYIKRFDSKTIFILDKFLSAFGTEDFIRKLHNAGIRNVIITSITDYMNPIVKFIGSKKGLINNKDFLDEYVKGGKHLPQGMHFIRLSEFVKTGTKIKENVEFPYEENQIVAYFLTGATTSQEPKAVKVAADDFPKMSVAYENLPYGFKRGMRYLNIIPQFYRTGAVHATHVGLLSGATNIYNPKYDRFAYAKDLLESKANIGLSAPSHVETFRGANLPDNSLKNVEYIFLGGEAIYPAQMRSIREDSRRLGIKHVIMGYGLTETGCVVAMTSLNPESDNDVKVYDVPGAKHRIVDPITREILPVGERGILEVWSPYQTQGYVDEEKNKFLFTEDGWINTGDVAVEYEDGGYRVYGRDVDSFVNNDQKYYMFDIEEKLLECPGVAEAEVIKFKINGDEFPANVVVLKQGMESDMYKVVKAISGLEIPTTNLSIGTRFIDNFDTNQVSGKRDYLSLDNEQCGYFKYNVENKTTVKNDVIGDIALKSIPISDFNIEVSVPEKNQKLLLVK